MPERVRLFTRNGYDFTARYPEDRRAASRACRCGHASLDGEAIVVDERGLSVFDLSVIGNTTMPPCSALSI